MARRGKIHARTVIPEQLSAQAPRYSLRVSDHSRSDMSSYCMLARVYGSRNWNSEASKMVFYKVERAEGP